MARIRSLDFAKGIGIIAVVLGHCMDNFSPVGLAFSSFRIPFFFVLSGFLLNDSKYSILELFHRRNRQLLVPFIMFSVIVTMAEYILSLPYDYSEVFLKAPFAIWFLGVLYVVEISYMAVCRVCKQNMCCRLAIVVVFAFLGLVLNNLEINLPFNLSAVPVALSYFAVGNILRELPFVWHFLDLRPFRLKGLLCAMILFAIPASYTVLSGHRLYIAENDFNPLNYVLSYIGVAGVFIASNCIRSKIIEWIGKNTLVILSLHMTIIQFTMINVVPLFHEKLIGKIVEQIILWTVLFFCIRLFNLKMLKWIVAR